MRTITRLLTILLVTGLFLSLSTPALAARNYLIELVVFTTQDRVDAEKWTAVHPPLNRKKMSRAIRPGEGELELNEGLIEIKESPFPYYVNRIRKNPARRVILSTHWVQTVLSPSKTVIAHISDVKARDRGQSTTITKSKNGFENEITPGLPLLDGFINFYLDGQYTLEADIRYTPPYRPSILNEEPDIGPVSYRIYEKRRMKSGELNYYDHPKFGMVLLVTPVVMPAEQASE